MRWLKAAIDYLPNWIGYQMRAHDVPGCALALVHRGALVYEQAFGIADLARGTRLTPAHRFRAASHSKSFTAAGLMKLSERGRLRLEDPVGRYVAHLHPAIARGTVAQLLSHGAGITRDGGDSGQFVDERPFPTVQELRAELARPPVIAPNTRFKYSNHGYALAGLVIEAVAGEAWHAWIRREVIAAAGLAHTLADGPLPPRIPLASGHSARLPAGRRFVIPGNYCTLGIAPAGGIVSTPADLARFFSLLSPSARGSFLSPASRRAMIRARWDDPHSRFDRRYGLGIISGRLGGWDWYGHSGALQGYVSRTCVFPAHSLALSVWANAIDAPVHSWLDGLGHLLRAYAQGGPPSRATRAWTGRWWTLWGAIDLLPMRRRIAAINPAFFDPLVDASEIAPAGRDRGRIALAPGFASHGEPAQLIRDARSRVVGVRLGGMLYRGEAALKKRMKVRYAAGAQAMPIGSASASRIGPGRARIKS